MATKTRTWLSPDEEQEIVQTIAQSEKESSGEIRVHLESRCRMKNPLDRAVQLFYQLGMDKTLARNGILIYLSIDDRQIAIIGDKGIHQHTGETFWEEVKQAMIEQIRQSKLSTGIRFGVQMCSAQLSKHFPPVLGDTNELSNEISVSE